MKVCPAPIPDQGYKYFLKMLDVILTAKAKGRMTQPFHMG